MAYQTATNPSTGEKVVLVGDQWKPYTQSATGANGAKAFLIDNKWLSETETPTKPDEVPGPRKEPTAWEKARPYVAPTIEALGAVGGGLIGTPLGPAGTVGGAGLGYGIAKEALNLADQYLGTTAPRQGIANLTEPLYNVAEGATMEAGGQVAGRVAGQALQKGASAIANLRGLPETKAARILRGSMGADSEAVINALRNAPAGTLPAQAAAGINAPAFQALMERAGARTPESVQFLTNALAQQEGARVAELARLAGGATGTETRATAEAMKTGANRVFEPVKEAALKGANLGRATQQYADEAAAAAAKATQAVEDVRRFVPAGTRIDEMASQWYPGEPGRVLTIPQREHLRRVAVKAEEVASQAAEGSLKFGEVSRMSQAASDALAAHGIKPLKTDTLIDKVRGIASNQEFAGNRDIPKVVERVIDDLRQWTNNKGVIDAFALDAIRKNSVNAAIRDLYPAADKNTQKELAAGILTQLRPALVDAVEQAGGKGYREYLASYADQMRKISEKKLTGKALELYKNSPQEFVKLVEGEAPDVVEKILGRGNYDIAKELSADVMASLRGVAGEVKRGETIAKQASEGRDALRTLYEQNVSKFKIPWGLSAKGAAINKALDIAESRVSEKTMRALTTASRSGEDMLAVLNRLPPGERLKILNAIKEVALLNVTRGRVVANALVPSRENSNALTD